MLLLSDQFSINVLSMHYQSMNYCYALIPATCYQSLSMVAQYATNIRMFPHRAINVRSTCYQRAIHMLRICRGLHRHMLSIQIDTLSVVLPIRSSGGGGYVINNCFYYCLLIFNASPLSRPDRLKTIYVFHHRL